MAQFELPDLPYAPDALEPYIDAQTMRVHHGGHHATYVTNANRVVEGHPELEGKSAEEILRHMGAVPEAIRTAVRNQVGGCANHSLFWTVMGPHQGGEPDGELKRAIDEAVGPVAAFRDRFSQAATGVFGSGWAWLVVRPDHGLEILTTPNQDSPYMQDLTPILGLDVWEHAYYLKYQNRRAEYVAAWWNVVNWPEVARRLAAARA